MSGVPLSRVLLLVWRKIRFWRWLFWDSEYLGTLECTQFRFSINIEGVLIAIVLRSWVTEGRNRFAKVAEMQGNKTQLRS